MKETIKKSIIGGVAFSLTVMIVGVTYAAFVNITTVNNGETLSSTLMNDLINNQKDLDMRISGISSVPTGAVIAFNGTTCPTGWNKANGSGDEKNTLGANTTLDLRGEFVRGLDDSRGVDSGRSLISYQSDSFQGHKHDLYSDSGGNNDIVAFSDSNNTFRYMADSNTSTTRGDSYIYVGNAITNGINGSPRTASETRPRNIALLYCVKD